MILVVFVYSLFLVYGAIKIQANFFMTSINETKTNKKQIALTFDDGPLENKTNLILDILKNNNIHAAFFCIGSQIEKHPSLLLRMHNEGHIIGNHSYSHHFFFDLKSVKEMQNELMKTGDIIEQNIHKRTRFFRPPYGVTNPNLARAVRSGNYYSIGWSRRSMDTVVKTEQKLLRNITGKLKAGDIVLLHDTAIITVQNLQGIIDVIKNKGFEIVRLDKLLNIEAYA
ncbi:MAG: polysaccharide deacetylase family protein [Bacteroidota bacterium]|nr:polysaccharide deacetylase family protein [Bacteroidota bacterium]